MDDLVLCGGREKRVPARVWLSFNRPELRRPTYKQDTDAIAILTAEFR